MMRCALTLHPDFACPAVMGIAVEAERSGLGMLTLRYLVSGAIGKLLLPTPVAPARGDALWEHSCFEAFVRAKGIGYREFNFAPSMQWAAYGFSGYRSGMRVATEIPAPEIESRTSPDRYEMRAALSGLPHDVLWQLGLSAVIEETTGRKSYWALAHPPGKLDFHHFDSFALQLPAQSDP